MPLFIGPTFSGALNDADGRPLAGAVPGRPAARPDRAADGHPAVLRRIHDPRDLAGGLEPRDHRAAGRARAALPRRRQGRTPMRSASSRRRACSWRWRSARSGGSTFGCRCTIDWHDPRIKQVFMLMLPVTIGLGIVNLDQLINSAFGSLVSDEAPRAIDNAFRIYMLPQGMFSVAVATVLFPVLSRLAARRDAAGMRTHGGHGHAPDQPAADPGGGLHDRARDADHAAALRTRRSSTRNRPQLVSEALFWFAFSLPFAGINLLLTRTFFALQRPWIPTRLAAMNIVVDIIVSVGLYKPLGIAGPGDRHGRRQRGDDGAAAAPPADRLQRPPGGCADDDDHGADRASPRRCWRASRGSSGTGCTRCSAARCRRRSSASARRARRACGSTRARCWRCASRRRTEVQPHDPRPPRPRIAPLRRRGRAEAGWAEAHPACART